MNKNRRQFGFSLIEALLATGILGIGLVLIAMVFPVGIKLTSVAAERTVAAVAANEAFGKIQLWGIRDFNAWTKAQPTDDPYQMCFDYRHVINLRDASTPPNYIDVPIEWPEFLYPSVAIPAGMETQKYHWSALCRAINEHQVQTTVFVTRKAAEGQLFYTPASGSDGSWPSPVKVNVSYDSSGASANQELRRRLRIEANPIFNQIINRSFFDDNTVIVADHNGIIYRVQEYIDSNDDNIKDTLRLTEDWTPSLATPNGGTVWVIPPGIGSTRNPVIGVVQKTITISP